MNELRARCTMSWEVLADNIREEILCGSILFEVMEIGCYYLFCIVYMNKCPIFLSLPVLSIQWHLHNDPCLIWRFLSFRKLELLKHNLVTLELFPVVPETINHQEN